VGSCWAWDTVITAERWLAQGKHPDGEGMQRAGRPGPAPSSSIAGTDPTLIPPLSPLGASLPSLYTTALTRRAVVMFEEQQHLFRCSRLPHLLERVWVSVELQQSGEFEVDGKKIPAGSRATAVTRVPA
jgi:hypothetical protein